MRRWWIAALCIALGVLAATMWRCHGRDRAGSKTTVPTTSPGSAHARPADPHTAPRASIAGTVRDEHGAAIANARICAATALVREPACASSDAAGSYAIGGLLPTFYEVDASAPTYVPAAYRPEHERHRAPLLLLAGERRAGIDLVLCGGGVALTGAVSDVGGGPVAHARIRVGSEDHRFAKPGRWSPPVESGADGAFTVWTAAGSVRLEATADGYAYVEQDAVAPGHVEILLTPEGSIAGTVVDTAGRPVEGADVFAEAIDVHEHDRSDAQGHFHITHLVPERYEVSARTAGGYGRSAGTTRVALGAHVDGVTVRIDAAARVSGRVETAPGVPCADPAVRLHDPARYRDVELVPDGDGWMHADGVLAGTYVVHPTCPGSYVLARPPSIVVANHDLDALVWSLTPGATIRGHVRGGDGAPVERAGLVAKSQTAYADATSAADGSYELAGLPPGDYDVTATTSHAGKATARLSVGAGAVVEHDFTVDEAALIRGVVVDTGGHPVGGIEVHANADGTDSAMSTVAADGSFTIDVRPGSYEVVASRDWQHPLAEGEDVVVAAGQTATVRLVVPPQNGTIRGDVVDAAGAPVSDTYVTANPGGAFEAFAWRFTWNEHPVLTAVDGTFEIRGLGPGSYTVEASRRGGGGATVKGVAIGTTLHLVIPTTGAIEGKVTYADGTHPDEMTLTIRDRSQDLYRRETFFHTDGAFTVTDLPPSALTIAATTVDGLGVTTTPLAAGEHRTGLAISLDRYVTLSGRLVDPVTSRGLADYFIIARTQRALLGAVLDHDNPSQLTDADGRFAIHAPTGQIELQISSAHDMMDHAWCFPSWSREIESSIDVGTLPVVRSRLHGEPAGQLGFTVGAGSLRVSAVDPRGPAAASVHVGDTIVSVDGVAVSPELVPCIQTLLAVPAGTSLALGLGRGASVKVVVGSPKP